AGGQRSPASRPDAELLPVPRLQCPSRLRVRACPTVHNLTRLPERPTENAFLCALCVAFASFAVQVSPDGNETARNRKAGKDVSRRTQRKTSHFCQRIRLFRSFRQLPDEYSERPQGYRFSLGRGLLRRHQALYP